MQKIQRFNFSLIDLDFGYGLSIFSISLVLSFSRRVVYRDLCEDAAVRSGWRSLRMIAQIHREIDLDA